MDRGGNQRIATTAKIVGNIGHHVVVGRILLHGARRALHVHHTDARCRFCCQRQHPRITLQARNVVDDLSTGLNRFLRDDGLGRIDRDRYRHLLGEPGDHGNDATSLFLDVDRFGIGSRTLPTHVEDLGPVFDKLQGVVHCLLKLYGRLMILAIPKLRASPIVEYIKPLERN